MKLSTILEDVKSVRPTIFVDLDGVLADFDSMVEKLVGPDWKKLPDKELWKYLKDNHQNFFALLDKMPQGMQLWKGILALAAKADYDNLLNISTVLYQEVSSNRAQLVSQP